MSEVIMKRRSVDQASKLVERTCEHCQQTIATARASKRTLVWTVQVKGGMWNMHVYLRRSEAVQVRDTFRTASTNLEVQYQK